MVNFAFLPLIMPGLSFCNWKEKLNLNQTQANKLPENSRKSSQKLNLPEISQKLGIFAPNSRILRKTIELFSNTCFTKTRVNSAKTK